LRRTDLKPCNRDDDSQRRAGINPQNARVSQRIARHALHQRARKAKRGPGQHRKNRARNARRDSGLRDRADFSTQPGKDIVKPHLPRADGDRQRAKQQRGQNHRQPQHASPRRRPQRDGRRLGHSAFCAALASMAT